MFDKLKIYFLRIFSFDYRSLAFFRILVWFIVMYDVVLGIRFLEVFHTDLGLMSLDILMTNYPDENIRAFHSISNNYWYQLILFCIHFVVAVFFTLWKRTKEMTVILWLFTCSMLWHNPQIINWADIVVKMLLFWSMFLPLWARWSFDFVENRAKDKNDLDSHRSNYLTTSNVCSRWTVALVMQLSVIYIVTAILKSDPIRTTEYTATYYALSLDTFVKPIWSWLYQFPDIMKGMTRASINLELYGMFLLLVPRHNKVWRLIAITIFIMFHFGLFLTMRLETFPWIMIAARLSLLPSVFRNKIWDKVESFLFRITFASRLYKYFENPLKLNNKAIEVKNDSNEFTNTYLVDNFVVYVQKYRWYITVFLVLCIWYVLAWNIRTTDFDRHDDWFPREVNRFGFLFRLDQYRNMFSPYPFVDDGRTVVKWVLKDWTDVNLLDHNKEVSFDKPKFGGTIYEHEKRRKVFTNLWMKSNSEYRQPMANYFCRKRNESHSDEEQVETVQWYYVLEKTLADYKTAPLEEVLLYDWDCR